MIARLLPSLSPTLSELALMMASDRIVLADRTRWSRKSHSTRVSLASGEDRSWIRVGVRTEDRRRPIAEIRAEPDRRWLRHAARTLRTLHPGGDYFDEYAPRLVERLEAIAASAERGEPVLPLLLRFRGFVLSRLHLSGRIPPEALESDGLALSATRAEAEPPCGPPGDPSSDPQARSLGDLPAEPQHVLTAPGSGRFMARPDGAVTAGFAPVPHPSRPAGFQAWDSALDLLLTLGPDSWTVTDRLPDALRLPDSLRTLEER